MTTLKDHIIETQNKMYAAEGSGDLEEFRRLSDYRNGLMDALKLVESPWRYLIDAAGKDTGERPPNDTRVVLSVYVEPVHTDAFPSVIDGHFIGGDFHVIDDEIGEPITVDDYWQKYGVVYYLVAFQPWPDPAPSPKGGK